MKLTFISDTHSQHNELQLGSGDVLIHCGDFTGTGSLEHTQSFAAYIGAQNFRLKIVVAGNHDFCLEDERRETAEQFFRDEGVIYLNDSGITFEGLKFWGSPIQPEFMNWAFNRARGVEIREHWQKIPDDIDILITHGPPMGILDVTYEGIGVGCEDLLHRVQKIRPKIHAFGHIHESYGVLEKEGVKYVNASNADVSYRLIHAPINLEI